MARSPLRAAALCCMLATPALAQTTSGPLLRAGSPSDLPRVAANDNTIPAGTVRDGVREISLEVVRADWRVESDDGPGLRVAAIAERGGPPMIPAPLVRVESGTRLRVRLRNRLLDVPVTVFGLHGRPAPDPDWDSDSASAPAPDSLRLEPGEESTIEFDAGEEGTYMYRVREEGAWAADEEGDSPERDQLAGAFVVDPAGGAEPDRVLVINIFSEPVDSAVSPGGWVEALTINGKSWPFTERFTPAVGERVRWRVVNASERFHPMHLHGFYYRVLSRGTETGDTVYHEDSRRLVVTEPMGARTTMLMEWSPARPGRWLFHCHLSFHVAPDIRLPGAGAGHDHGEVHMAGLVLGIDVPPGPSDLIARGETRRLSLFVNEYGDEVGYRYGFAVDPSFRADRRTDAPGPVLVFRQHEAVDVTVHNRMTIPTAVHWHGLELDAWADGVPGWSASDGKVSPTIAAADSFTYRLSLMRPGTFIYHSHLDDIHQLTGGLYGALLVLPEGEDYDPVTDHLLVFGWKTPDPRGLEDAELNGTQEPPPGQARVGERHRFRLINIAPAGRVGAWLTRGDEVIPITLLAKDGADLPPHQQVPVPHLVRLGVGETADFTWTPAEPGLYQLRIGPAPDFSLVQTWEVTDPRPEPGVKP